MYRKQEHPPIPPSNFELTFEGKLSENNRWVIMASLIPWSEFEEEYSSSFSPEMGAPAKSFRMALGALIIKEKLGISDRETVEQIKENPYLQYFIGMSSYTNEAPFDASMLVHFRERISKEKKKQDLEAEKVRNCIEGKFGQAKRRFSLGRVMAKQTHTSQTAIAITFERDESFYSHLTAVLCFFVSIFETDTFFPGVYH